MKILRLSAPLWLAIVWVHAAFAQSELWDKAAALSERARDYVPGTMTSTVEELNGDGSRKSITQSVLALTYDQGAKNPKTQLVRATRDGKDVTAEMSKGYQNAGRGSGGAGGFYGFDGMLFDEKSRAKIHFLPGASWVARDGKRLGLIPFEMNMDGKGRMTGQVEIDADSGMPVVAHLQGRFPYLERLAFDLFYAPLPSGGFVLSATRYEGVASFLIVKRPFRGSLELGAYTKVSG